MRHHIFFIGIFALLLLSSCSREQKHDPNQIILKGTIEPAKMVTDGAFDTKSTISSQVKFIWTKGDKIGTSVCEQSKFTPFAIKSGLGSENASFVGSISQGGTLGDIVIYPYSSDASLSGDVLTLNMPATYDYTEFDTERFGDIEAGQVNSFGIPMIAKNTGESLTFKHLGGCFIFEIENIPAGCNIFEFKVGSTQKITGDFTVDTTADEPVYTVEKARKANTVTIEFWPLEETGCRLFCVPVPVGTYEYEWFIYDTAEELQGYGSSEGTKEIVRGKVRVAKRTITTISTQEGVQPLINNWNNGANISGNAE